MKLVLFIFLVVSTVRCGRAQFSAVADAASDTTVPVVSTGTDYYVEIGEKFADQVAGEVTLTNVEFLGLATWPGATSLQFELRLALSGTTAVGDTTVSLSQPSAWSTAAPILNVTLPAGSNNYELTSGNIKESASEVLKQSEFWIVARVRSGGLDFNKDLSLTSLSIRAEGEKNLNALAPLIDLGF